MKSSNLNPNSVSSKERYVVLGRLIKDIKAKLKKHAFNTPKHSKLKEEYYELKKERNILSKKLEYGFHRRLTLQNKLCQFMNLDELQCGDRISSAFVTKYLMLYINLCECKIDGSKYYKLNDPLLDLFKEDIKSLNLDIDKFSVLDLQKCIFNSIITGKLDLSIQVSENLENIRYKPGNFEIVDDFLNKLRTKYREYLSTKNTEMLEKIKAEWMAFGLTSLYFNDENRELKFYGGDDDSECAICMDADKDVIFRLCLHFCCCSNCAKLIENCCICRSPIIKVEIYN